jgi:hypothetical protein
VAGPDLPLFRPRRGRVDIASHGQEGKLSRKFPFLTPLQNYFVRLWQARVVWKRFRFSGAVRVSACRLGDFFALKPFAAKASLGKSVGALPSTAVFRALPLRLPFTGRFLTVHLKMGAVVIPFI